MAGVAGSMISAPGIGIYLQTAVIIFGTCDVIVQQSTMLGEYFGVFRVFGKIFSFTRIFFHIVQFFSVAFQIMGVFISRSAHHASGLRSVEDVRHILSMGADKAAINTAAIKRPELITEVAEAFGSQCMVLSIQAKRSRTWPGKWEAYYDNGRAHSGYDVVEWAKRGVALGAGEILLTSVDNEGLQQGMDLELIEAVTKAVNVPVICGGGVGCGDDIVDAANAGADAVACAAVLHYKKETVTELKEDIRAGGVEVRQV